MYNHQLQISNLLERQLKKSKHLIDVLNVERQDLEYLNNKMLSQLVTKLEENKLSQEEIAELKKALNKWRLGGAGTALGIVALLILL